MSSESAFQIFANSTPTSPSHVATPFVPLSPVVAARDTSTLTLYVGVALYGLAIVIGAVDVLWNFFTQRYATHTTHKETRIPIKSRAVAVEKLFKGLLFVCLLFRVIWLLLRALLDNSDATNVLITFAISRVAFGFFFSCFTLVVFYWAESVHSSTYASEEFLPKLGVAFLITNAIMWAFQVIVVALFLSGAPMKEGNPVYEANILTELGLSFVLSMAFAIYGTSLLVMRCRSEDNDPSRFKYTVTSTVVTVLFVLCFALRVVAFGYRYVTHTFMPPNEFIVIAYYIPELLPAMLQIYLVESSKSRVTNADQYIADLYAGEADKSLEEALRNGAASPTKASSVANKHPSSRVYVTSSQPKFPPLDYNYMPTHGRITERTPLVLDEGGINSPGPTKRGESSGNSDDYLV